VLTAQESHAVFPSAAADFPAGQSWQVSASVPYLPMTQLEQAVPVPLCPAMQVEVCVKAQVLESLGVLEYLPAMLHLVQEVAPTVVLYLPMSQSTHPQVPAAVAYLPFVQATQIDAPTSDPVPSGHRVKDEDDAAE